MAFNSVSYIFSLMIVALFFYMTPDKYKWILLLIASCIFYMAWSPILIILMLFVIFINFIFSLLISKEISDKKRKTLLLVSMLLNFGILFVFKYAMFFSDSFRVLFEYIGITYVVPKFSIILPMGISFYTFQATGYTIDVFRGDVPVEKNFFKLTLFIIFFPQLVAGPIERTDALMPQLFSPKLFMVENLVEGFKYMIVGYFKKVVIADRTAMIVNTVYNSPTKHEGLAFIIATIFFAFQLYCDFSGYSEIAKGSAKIFGIDLMDNFNTPYLSKSIKEFWRRWHISLSTWFKDYLYIPLGGNRVSTSRKYLNLFITFLVSGLWHGANWTFVIWGALHGIVQILEDIFIAPLDRFLKKIKLDKFFLISFVKVTITFIIVCISYVFFRGNNVSDSVYILKNLSKGFASWSDPNYIFQVFNNMGVQLFEILLSIFAILVLVIIDLFSQKENIHQFIKKRAFVIQFLFYFIITTLVFTLGVFHDAGAFIYFQF